MYVSVAILSSLLAGQALANANVRALAPFPAMEISKRQGGDSFIPPTTPGCPADLPICGTSNTCYDSSQGEVCCPGGTYVCPGESFCLQDGYCCPDGEDPETCAKNNGITLTSTTAAPTSTSAPTTSKPVIPTSSSSSASTPVVPVPTTTPTETATTSSEPPVFTGGANARVGGAVAAVLGGLGVVGNLLI